MASETEIANMAISHVGLSKRISNLESDRSTEGLVCRVFYGIARDTVLRDFDWPFATRVEALGLVEENPTTEWDYSYQYPSNCLFFRKILSGTRNDTNTTVITFKLASSAQGQVIYTDKQNAEGEYTFKETDPGRFSPDFTLALSFLMASLIASSVTAGDPYKMGDKTRSIYQSLISIAKANAKNEEQAEPDPDSEFIRIRE